MKKPGGTTQYLNQKKQGRRFYVLRSFHRNGFVALFAVLISSVVLTISLGLLTIAIKEVTLSSSGRESQYAFYAADAGIECGLYWDLRGKDGSMVFPTSTDSTAQIPGSGILCNGQDITTTRSFEGISYVPWDMDINESEATTTTTFWINISGKSCAKVQVAKNGGLSKVDSYGYNICDFNNPRVVERAIRVTY